MLMMDDAYLGSASDWMKQTNQKHYPELGSDASSVWNFCAVSQMSFCGGNQLCGRGVVKCRCFLRLDKT